MARDARSTVAPVTASREYDIVSVRGNRLRGQADGPVPGPGRRQRADRAGRPLDRSPAGDPRDAGGVGAVVAGPAGGCLQAVDAGCDGRPDAGGRHDRRPLHPLRPAVGGRLRRCGHRLRGPDRRAAVRPREHRPVPQAGSRHRRPHRARVRIRFDPFGSHRLRAVPQGARRRRGRTRRHRLRGARVRGWVLRRHGRLGRGSVEHRLQGSRCASPIRRSLHAEPGPRCRTRIGRPTRPATAPRQPDRTGARPVCGPRAS